MENMLVGYMAGCDALWLTTLEAHGCDTIPVSNGYDGHGKNIQMFSPNDKVDLVITYFHKLMPPLNWDVTVDDILHRTATYGIPVLAVCPAELIDKAMSQHDSWPSNVEFIDPADVLTKVQELLAAKAVAV